MRRVWIAVVLAVATAGCRQLLPTNKYLQFRKVPEQNLSTADARRAFNHPKHEKVFAGKGITCVDCHQFDVEILTPDDALADALSKRASFPGSAACHSCHRQGELRVATAPGPCYTCHQNLYPLLPSNHEVAWQTAHATVARSNPTECEQCHRQSYCVDCHTRRDTIQTIVHERNYRMYHGVDARANPLQCGSCHREDYCSNCHRAAKVEVHP